MPLPDAFTFSARNLQAYADCPRRFELRYIQRWHPPAMTAPDADTELAYEKRLRQGAKLHELACLAIQGVPRDLLTARLDGEVARWLDTLLDSGMRDLPANRLPEKRLQATLDGESLMALVDLLAYERGGELVIVDWKTGGHVPDRHALRRRWQSIAYLYVAASVGGRLMDESLAARRVRLDYIYLARDGQRVSFAYSAREMADDAARLQEMMREIRAASDFPLTDDERHCRFCAFRVHCERDGAGDMGEFDYDEADEDGDDVKVDFEQIGEVAF